MRRPDTARELPLLSDTRPDWAPRAAERLPEFLADHAICEQQAALTALNLLAHYPDDDELVRRMTSLAAEEVAHLRRVTALLHARGLKPHRRRTNPFVAGLHARISKEREDWLKLDRLLVGALIEARSCERFTLLLDAVRDRDPEVAALLFDLGPAERRHWEMFYGLAAREVDRPELERRWSAWLRIERDLISERGDLPTVHG